MTTDYPILNDEGHPHRGFSMALPGMLVEDEEGREQARRLLRRNYASYRQRMAEAGEDVADWPEEPHFVTLMCWSLDDWSVRVPG